MDKVGELLPSVGTALAGLVLVFLGAIFTTFDSFDAEHQEPVRKKYRFRAWMAFLAFLLSVASAACGLVGVGCQRFRGGCDVWGCILLAISFTLLAVVALLAILEI